ncbi:alpha/beta fold hydrolase [Corynebacterium crudilactis]|uniref:Hydrolase n=1 Tax=Corynebacterium crudilactis TaxID=1652495 RepID=A0A172QQQ2_9CORY|nr:alpha/beta hydrolase [Corynebacterium crudilactis]ANE03025.1 hydrolase [Corynebacterium crudilactis]
MALFSLSTSPLTRFIPGNRSKTATAQRRLAHTIASIERSPGIVALDGPFTHDHVSVRGIRLHLAEAGSPTNPLVLLIHGAFGGWYDFRDVIGPLADAGFHVAAIDLRGYGMSDKPPTGYDLRHAAGEISSLIAALGHDNAFLVGSDTGASIAWATASIYPERVNGLVSLGAIHPLDMRRAIRRKPYLHLADIGRLLLFRVPTLLHKAFHFSVSRVARREIANNTSPSYQRSNAFTDTVRLRKKALSIDHTTTPIIRTNRYLVAGLPSKNARNTISAPVLILKTNTRRWEHLATTARARVTGAMTTIAIPGGFELPYLEHPAEFAATIAKFARSAV